MNGNLRQKTVAAFITAIILLLLFWWMEATSLPQKDLVAERYDQINWMRYVPRPQPERQPDSEVEKQAPKPRPNPVEPTIRRIDLSDLEKQMSNTELPVQTRTRRPPGKAAARPTTPRISLDEDLDAGPGDLSLGFNENSPLVPTPGRRRGGSGEVQIQAQSSGAEGSGGLSDLGEELGGDLEGPEARGVAPNAGTVEIPAIPDVGEGAENLSPLYRPLIEWMKRHPGEFPPVVKRFTNYEPGHLTSIVRFRVDGREFQMFLLCVEATYEVRIVLVEGRDVTYLIDQGFRQKTNYLRTGYVARLSDGSLLKFDTNLQPASNRRSRDFYRIFLSWWESVKHEVE
ncbi:MAG: hypothetical protein D6681_13045 [Calditrichaeota bacterium]|nr:MAG: hypothetical protein D6681_13045 [Calditrichota bacterium]